jgi:hypothetical protein
MKNKETLEEAAEKYWVKQPYNEDAFIDGAKWQQERMYSEEEVRELLIQRCKHFGTSLSPFDKILLKQDLEWFEQFKKKEL